MSANAPLMLSVSGARGIVGKSMTPDVAMRLAAAYGTVVRARAGTSRPTMCLGRDGRPSGEGLAAAAVAGLTAVGCDVIDLGIAATPSVGVMIMHHGAAGGLVITASHNPEQWNGLKCLNGDGVAPPPADAAEIIDRFERGDAVFVEYDGVGSHRRDDTAHEMHVDRILAAIDPEPIRACGFTVALDSVNGAGGTGGRLLLDRLGCRVIHLNGEPTGRFAHTPEPAAAHLTELSAELADSDAVVGFAQDPDADRLAILDETGAYIGEEYTLVLAARQVLAGGASGNLATNLSTSRMIDDVAAAAGRTVARTAVGEANVVAAMQQNGSAIGGEGNGGVIFPAVCWVRDSLSSMALVLALMAREKRPLSAIVADTPAYAMVKEKFDLGAVGGRSAVDAALERIRASAGSAKVNDADGVRLDYEDGWVHARPSNTEPIVRLIAEAATEARAGELIDSINELLVGEATA